MDFNQIIGLEVCDAETFLSNQGITNFKFVYYVDRKQTKYDKELVTAVKVENDCIILIVCRYLLRV